MDSGGRRNFQAGGSSASNKGLSGNEGSAEQFERLRTIVPNLDKMDERTILEKTEEYVRRINDETWKIQRELSQKRMENNALDGDGNSMSCIFSVESEKMGEKNFVVKVGWKGKQMAGKVQAMLESCGFDITQTSIAKGSPHSCTTVFVQVEQIGMTDDQLYEIIYGAAERFGMLP